MKKYWIAAIILNTLFVASCIFLLLMSIYGEEKMLEWAGFLMQYK